jgi:hypothetical protein
LEYTTEELLRRIRFEIAGKWHVGSRIGNDGNAGNTLEDLLGIPENNLKLPDWGEIELKTHQVDSSSLLTLLHREPLPRASVPKLIKSLGWKHEEAGNKYPLTEKSFRSTTYSGRFSDRGFSIRLTDDHIEFIFVPEEVSREKADRTGVYSTYGKWLEDVESRRPHYSECLPVYWKRDYLEGEISAKLNNTLFCSCKKKKFDGVPHFQYTKFTLLQGFRSEKLEDLLLNNALYLDFDARSGHNHGTKVRVDINKVHLLFERSIQIF